MMGKPLQEDIKDKLNELKYLEKSIGSTGKLAIAPIFTMSSKDLWQLYILDQLKRGGERQPYLRFVLCPTSII